MRTKEHTEALIDSESFTMKELWDSYGIVGELTVSFVL